MAGLQSESFLPSGGLDAYNRNQSQYPGSGSYDSSPSILAASMSSPTNLQQPRLHQHQHLQQQHLQQQPQQRQFQHWPNPQSSSSFVAHHNIPDSRHGSFRRHSSLSPTSHPAASSQANPQQQPHSTTTIPPIDISSSSLARSYETPAYLRSSSLSPTKGFRKTSLPISTAEGRAWSPSSPPNPDLTSSLSRSVSADAGAPHQQPTPVHLVQRLSQQNAIIREAWEAERNYLEANRRRAEEVYQEERAIMEQVREGWEDEKMALEREIQALKERVHRLEGENSTLRAVAAHNGVASPLLPPRAASTDFFGVAQGQASSAPPPPMAPAMSLSPSQQSADAAFLPPGLDGASRRPHWANPGSARTSPSGQPELSPFIPLDPRMQTQAAEPKDFLTSSSSSHDGDIPVIDVHEIDPKLEGIPIKATAVQRSTFGGSEAVRSETSKQSSPNTSPPAAGEVQEEASRPGLTKRSSSKDHTLQVLAAEESRRLTMHAGHTPNHSLSLFPTMNPIDNASATVSGPSEGPTPTAGSISAPRDEPVAEKPTTVSDTSVAVFAHKDEDEEYKEHKRGNDKDPQDEQEHGDQLADIIHPEQVLEPADDIPLKGPLMIKNIPAQDEIFWDLVNQKLEPISQGRDSLPTVMRAALEELEPTAGPSRLAALEQQRRPHTIVPVGGDASHDARLDQPKQGESGGSGDSGGSRGVDPEVPLKLKTTTNFGAPFGKV